MKGKLIIVISVNLTVLLSAYIFSLIREPYKSDIVAILVGIGIIIFIIWSFGHGNIMLYRLAKLPEERLPTNQVIWNFFKILIGGMIFWNLIFELF